ncbi:MAG: hypothetical protein QOH47_2866 [Sphingomonadales bacterium]|jgi:hypothetical protein|nr:hypothetical protein [Sphingomonadales bacterium]
MFLRVLLAVQLAVPAPASGQDSPPDPASLTLPDMTPIRDAGIIRDGWRHFYFHKAGVSYAEAYEDFRDCYRFLPVPGANGLLPMFVPWTERPGAGHDPTRVNNYGLVGSIIGGLVQGTIDRRDRQSRMRRCMEPKGYVRYPLAEEPWRQLIDSYSSRSIALQALVASRPAPDLPQVTR